MREVMLDPVERKALMAVSVAGAAVALFGAVLIVIAAILGLRVAPWIARGDWGRIGSSLLELMAFAVCSALLLWGGARAARDPDRTEPKPALDRLFVVLVSVLFAFLQLILGHICGDIPKGHQPGWVGIAEKFVVGVSMVVCLLAYCATCRWVLRRMPLNEARRAALANPPPQRIIDSILMTLAGTAYTLIEPLLRDHLWTAMLLGGAAAIVLLLAHWRLRGALGRYLASPGFAPGLAPSSPTCEGVRQ